MDNSNTSPTPPEPPPPPRRRLRPLALVGLAALLLAAGAPVWLATTESGFRAFCTLASAVSGGRLRLVPAGGVLAGPFELEEAVWHQPGMTVRIKDANVDWSPAALRHRRLDIARLAAANLRIETAPASEPLALPASLRLPLAARIGEFRIGRLERGGTLLAEDVAGGFTSDGVRHRLTGLRARAGPVGLAVDAELEGDAPFPLSATGSAAGQLEGHPFSLTLEAGGRLAAIDIAGQAGGALQGRLAALATPFEPQPFQRLQVHLRGFDPATWLPGAPGATLDLDADLLPRRAAEWTVSGPFSVINRAPGPIDARRLPVERLSGRADWRGEVITFSGLSAALAGGGSLAGQGRLAGRQLDLELTASRLDAATLHPRLRPTRLAGPINLRIGPAEQSLAADLTDPQFRLAARLTRRGERVDIASLQLGAGPARLQARGHLDLDAAYRFEADGELARFDPSRFAQVPAASLNATFTAAGTLQPRPALALRFVLGDSRFKGQPLGGRGEVDIAWPTVRRAEVRLVAGPNRLEAHGAFGRPGDSLAILIDAPTLGPYGIAGGLRGQLRLAGTPAAPAFGGRLQAERLGLPGGGLIRGLEAEGESGARAGDPLRLDLRIAAVDLAERPDAAQEVSVHAEGSRARHTLRAAAALAGQRRLTLAAAGGLAERGGVTFWSGQLEQGTLTAADPSQNLRLLQPAPLRLGSGEWALGPAELAGAEWRSRLLASAARGRLQAEASGAGERLGKIDARLEARLQGAWRLAQEAPWQGRLDLAAADVAWLGPLLGEDWRTAGRLQGNLLLAGTPARPLLSGQMQGTGLGLRIPSRALQLENGKLQADLAGDRLRVATLAFDSRLRPLPPALQRSPNTPAALTATPGRLEIKGEIGLGGPGRAASPERGFLDLRLDRVGILQQPDEWVAVSGGGRLHWQGAVLAAEGKLQVDAGYWELASLGMPRLSDDVVIRTAGRPPATRPKLDLDVEIDAGPDFHFSGAGLESRLAGSVHVKASGRDLPRATGTIRTVGGKFDAYGQTLAVTRGIVNFQGFVDNPGLNVRAVRRGLPVEPGVEVTGTVKKPVVRLVSDPELPEAEKLSWLVLGHGSEQIGGGDASTLVAAASSILGRNSSGGVVQQLERRFGVEEFGVRQGSISDTGTLQATSRVAGGSAYSTAPGITPGTTGDQIVTVSKRLAANVLLSYEQALGRTENIVKLTVNLSRRLSVVGRAGSDNAIDLFYTLRFGK